jgi:hypothetical protein
MRPFPAALSLLALAAAIPSFAQAPKTYDCYRASTPIHIDGNLNDPAWRAAPWTTNFVDIQGSSQPRPRFRTRAKVLWDDTYLYVAAELQEPDVHATLTQHDSPIYRQDNNFEVFLKPPPSNPVDAPTGYFEFEINALNTSWDLYMNKPYNKGGKADSSWEIPSLKTAIAVHGTLNKSTGKDHGWTVEMAFPWTAFSSRLPVATPKTGDEWRLNFSRVEWKAGQPKEDNWVWTPQGAINMHVPEKWGYLRFKSSQ